MYKKKVVVIGAGISGKGAITLLKKKGAKVYVYDDVEQRAKSLAEIEEVNFLSVKNFPTVLATCDCAVLSPGVSANSNVAVMAEALGVKVISELELGYLNCPRKIIAVTGTNGKSSMVRLIDALIKASGTNSCTCGNIGVSFSGIVDELSEDGYAVVETSSFQLETVKTFKPYIALLLNIKPDHLDRHISFADYLSAKSKILENVDENGIVIGNFDDENVTKTMKNSIATKYYFSTTTCVPQGIYMDGDDVIAVINGQRYRVGKVSDLVGIKTPLANALALLTVSIALNIQFGLAYKTLREFEPLPHTMQKVCEYKKVNYVDDSKGTNISATLCAVNNTDGNVVLICGGRTKGESYAELFTCLPQNIISTVCLGENAEELSKLSISAGIKSQIALNVNDAVKLASLDVIDEGGTVLFSPATASFDAYRNYVERGEAFINAVKEYAQE